MLTTFEEITTLILRKNRLYKNELLFTLCAEYLARELFMKQEFHTGI